MMTDRPYRVRSFIELAGEVSVFVAAAVLWRGGSGYKLPDGGWSREDKRRTHLAV